MTSRSWRCTLLIVTAMFASLYAGGTLAQHKALPEPVFAAALETARKYADDRTLINFCLRADDEAGFLYLAIHDDLEQTRQRMQAAGASMVQVAELLRSVITAVRYAARDATDARLEQVCVQRDVATGYALLKAEAGATPLFMRSPFSAMKR